MTHSNIKVGEIVTFCPPKEYIGWSGVANMVCKVLSLSSLENHCTVEFVLCGEGQYKLRLVVPVSWLKQKIRIPEWEI